eukprot:932006-Rhodomonas_salina.2
MFNTVPNRSCDQKDAWQMTLSSRPRNALIAGGDRQDFGREKSEWGVAGGAVGFVTKKYSWC